MDRVSYNNIVNNFLPKLNREGAEVYRLPTEEKWEYVSRAGSRIAYLWGDAESRLDEFYWFVGKTGDTTHPVGKI